MHGYRTTSQLDRWGLIYYPCVEGDVEMKKLAQSLSLILALFTLVSCSSDLKSSQSSSGDVKDSVISVDVSDTLELTYQYIVPLIQTGEVWFYTWETASEIRADDLIDIFCNSNWLNLPYEWGQYVDKVAPADDVEHAIQKYFDVSNDYLKTSDSYNPDDDTYDLSSGWGGGWGAGAMSAKQEADKLIVQVGISLDLGEPVFCGTLAIRLTDNQDSYQYLSYIMDEHFRSEYEKNDHHLWWD